MKSNLTFLYKKPFSGRSILPTRMVNFSFSYIFCFLIYMIFITADNSRLYTLQRLLSKQFALKKRKNHKALLCESDLFLLQKQCVPKWIACLLVLLFFQVQTYKTGHSTAMKHFAHINCSRLTQFLFHVCVSSFTISDQQKVALQQFTQAFRIISVQSILMVRR